jgi:hypothetical protein
MMPFPDIGSNLKFDASVAVGFDVPVNGLSDEIFSGKGGSCARMRLPQWSQVWF